MNSEFTPDNIPDELFIEGLLEAKLRALGVHLAKVQTAEDIELIAQSYEQEGRMSRAEYKQRMASIKDSGSLKEEAFLHMMVLGPESEFRFSEEQGLAFFNEYLMYRKIFEEHDSGIKVDYRRFPGYEEVILSRTERPSMKVVRNAVLWDRGRLMHATGEGLYDVKVYMNSLSGILHNVDVPFDKIECVKCIGKLIEDHYLN